MIFDNDAQTPYEFIVFGGLNIFSFQAITAHLILPRVASRTVIWCCTAEEQHGDYEAHVCLCALLLQQSLDSNSGQPLANPELIYIACRL